jgi:predicted TIM-barrel fold metal-dependent hydrolase
VCLHTGSSGWAPIPSPDPPFELFPTLFPASSLIAATDWLWSGVCHRFPDLQIAMSEGGIGWVAMLADRADYVLDHSASGTESRSWKGDLRPSEVLARNFWFCTIDDPSSVDAVIARMGPDHIMVESDYPHADSTWPDTAQRVQANFGHLPAGVIRKVTIDNAAALFGVEVPAGV